MPKEDADLKIIRDFVVAQTTTTTVSAEPSEWRSCEPCSPTPAQVEQTASSPSSLRVCKAWARGLGCQQRGCPFRHSLEGPREVRRAARARLQRDLALLDNRNDEEDDKDALGDGASYHYDDVHAGASEAARAKASHGARHAEFARFLVGTFGRDTLSAAHGILDVGGGRGGLSFELHVRHGLPTTLLEPRETISLKSNQRRELRKKAHLQPFRHVCARLGFDDDGEVQGRRFESTAEGAALLAGASVLVGMVRRTPSLLPLSNSGRM